LEICTHGHRSKRRVCGEIEAFASAKNGSKGIIIREEKMAAAGMNEKVKKSLLEFLKKNKKADLVSTYLNFVEKKFVLEPILFPKEKKIYKSLDNLVAQLEKEGKLWRETELKIQLGQQTVNEQTQKIYICPFTGKAFGDNTCPNPQDAIYDWVSNCPENTERVGGLKAKRFYISDDPEVIKNYIPKEKKTINKIVYSSAITGKLFNSKEAVVEDFKKNHVKLLTLLEVQNQNRFEIEEEFLSFLQDLLTEDKITKFIETLAEMEEFAAHVQRWTSEEK
jgi:hypothetical protein